MDGGQSPPTLVPGAESSLARYVKERRAALGLSQADLAARCAVSQKTISLIESGQTQQPRLGLLHRLAGAFGDSRAILECRVLDADQPASHPAAAQGAACPHCGSPTVQPGSAPAFSAVSPVGPAGRAGGRGLQQARALVDALLLQAMNHPSDDVVQVVRQAASFLAAEYGSRDPRRRASQEVAVHSLRVVGPAHPNGAQGP